LNCLHIRSEHAGTQGLISVDLVAYSAQQSYKYESCMIIWGNAKAYFALYLLCLKERGPFCSCHLGEQAQELIQIKFYF